MTTLISVYHFSVSQRKAMFGVAVRKTYMYNTMLIFHRMQDAVVYLTCVMCQTIALNHIS